MSPTSAAPSFYPSMSPNTAFIITTVAGTGSGSYSGDGGAATSAGVNLPQGLALDSSGIHYHTVQMTRNPLFNILSR